MTRQRIWLSIGIGLLTLTAVYFVVTGLRTCAWLDRLTGRSGCLHEIPVSAFYDSVVFSPDGRILAIDGTSQPVGLYDPEKGTLFALNDGSVVFHYMAGVEFSSDGRSLLDGRNIDAGDRKETAFDIWKLDDGSLIRTVQVPPSATSWIYAVAFAPGDQSVMVAADQNVQSYRLDGTLIDTIAPEGYRPDIVLGFSPSGRLLAARDDKTFSDIHLWQMPAGTPMQTLHGSDAVSRLVFSPDDSLLAAISGHQVFVWQLASGKQLFTLGDQSQTDEILGLAFSPDGKTLVTTSGPRSTGVTAQSDQGASVDNMVRFWNLADGTLIRSLQPAEKETYYRAAAFSPDGHTLALISSPSYPQGSYLRLWNVSK